jgi:hypothetical protein
MIFGMEKLSQMWWIVIIKFQIIVVLAINHIVMRLAHRVVTTNQRYYLTNYSAGLTGVNGVNDSGSEEHTELYISYNTLLGKQYRSAC